MDYTSEQIAEYLQIHESIPEDVKKIAAWALSNNVYKQDRTQVLNKYMAAHSLPNVTKHVAFALFLFTKSPFAILNSLIDDEKITDLIITKGKIKAIRGSSLLCELPILDEMFTYIYNSFQAYGSSRLGPDNPFLNVQFRNARINMVHDKLTGSKNTAIVIRVDHTAIVNSETIDGQLGENLIGLYSDMANNPKNVGGHIFVGVTGSGKTTMLRYFLEKKEAGMNNLITLEDVNELKIDGALSFVATKETSISDLFVNSLRQAPSSLVIGEARDKVLLDILEAGLVFPSFTTIHSNSFKGFLLRSQLMTREVIDSRNLMKIMGEVVGGVTIMRDQRPYEIWDLSNSNATCIYGPSKDQSINIYDWA